MPQQEQMSSLAKKLGGRIASANAEHAGKPVDLGNRKLPGGIRAGIARLSSMYWKEYEDDKQGLKGNLFFRGSAIVTFPKELNGEKIEGLITQVIIPLCDVPAKGLRKPSTFEQNWNTFQNLFKMLGVPACNETLATDPTGKKVEAYFIAAMKALTDPVRVKVNPVYISFSTRSWVPPKPLGWKEGDPVPQEMVFESWHGLAKFPAPDPAAGVTAPPPPQTLPPPPAPAAAPAASGAGVAGPPVSYDRNDGPGPEYQPPDRTPEEEVPALVEAAAADPNGETEEGVEAARQLEGMAWARGWTKEQTVHADNWSQVGYMALNDPPPPPEEQPQEAPSAQPHAEANGQTDPGLPQVGSRWNFCRRTKDGAKLTNKQGVEFPAQEVEVTAVFPDSQTCTVKTVKDGKEVVDVRNKRPVAVRFDWLEKTAY